MANGSNLATFYDLQANPLGTGRGESFGMPQNYTVPPARIFVRNHSRTRKWKRLVIPVSPRRGAEDALAHDKALREIYNVDTLTKKVADGMDMSRYKTEVHPVAFKVRVPGRPDHHGGCQPSFDVVVLPADTADEEPKAVEVPEGTWDLYLGNYERMKGIVRSKDGEIVEKGNPIVIGEEQTRLRTFWSRRHNPVFAYTDEGETHDLNNPFGVLEFVRVPVKLVTEPIDREWLTSLDLQTVET